MTADKKKIELKSSGLIMTEGPCEVKIVSGGVSVVGAQISAGGVVQVPAGKKVPFEAASDSNLEMVIGEGGGFENISQKTIPESWDALADNFISGKPPVILVLGEMDTGKTFFTTYIANKLITAGLTTAVIDCDTGQSDLGPPGSLGMVNLASPVVFLSELDTDEMYFTGSHSPGLHLMHSIVGIKKLAEHAVSVSDCLIIDTPGWVQGDGGRLLRRSEMEILSPDAVVLLQRDDEIEHLVRHIPENKIHRIKVSKKASNTPQTARKELRESISGKYFNDSREHVLEFDDFNTDRTYFKTGRPIDLEVDNLWAERLSAWEGILVVSEKSLSDEAMNQIKTDMKVFNVRNIA